MPHTQRIAVSGLSFTSADFSDLRTHGTHMRLDDLPTPFRRFVARVSASVATVDSSPGCGWVSHAAEHDFASVFAVPIAVSEGSAETSATTTSVVQPTPSRSSVQGTNSVEPTGPTASDSTSPGSSAPQMVTQVSDRISTRTRGVQQQQLAMHPLLSTMASNPAGLLDHLPGALQPRRESHGRGRLSAPPRPLPLLTRRSARCPFRSTATT